MTDNKQNQIVSNNMNNQYYNQQVNGYYRQIQNNPYQQQAQNIQENQYLQMQNIQIQQEYYEWLREQVKESQQNPKQSNGDDDIKYKLITYAISSKGIDPMSNITAKDIAKDLRVGENKANEIFQREDFPSVNIGKTKTISILSYMLWKMSKRKEV